MTIVEAIEAVGRVSFRNPALDRFSVRAVEEACSPYALHVEATYFAPDRATGERTRITHRKSIPLSRSAQWMMMEIVEFARGCFLHEFDEATHVDGVRIHDPHAKERR